MCKEGLTVELSFRITSLLEKIGCILVGSFLLRYFPILFIIFLLIYIMLHLKQEIKMAIAYLDYKYTAENFDKAKKKNNIESINLDTISDADFMDDV